MVEEYKVRVYHTKSGTIKHATLEWIKQQTGVCELEGEFKAFKRRVMSYFENEAKKKLFQKFKECGGKMDTRQLTRFAWEQECMLETDSMLNVIEHYKNYGFTFKSQGRGKVRMWFLKRNKNE